VATPGSFSLTNTTTGGGGGGTVGAWVNVSPANVDFINDLTCGNFGSETMLVDPATGQDIVSDKRTSYGMFFRLAENDFIARIDRRLSALTNLPIENGEGLQVLHYPVGGGSEPHFDYLQPTNVANRESIARSGQRVSTLVTYLNDVPAGGQTVFPTLGWAVSPLRGNAVYFEYCDDAGRVDPRSLHASAPVTQGEKWVVTKWMRQRRFVSAGS